MPNKQTTWLAFTALICMIGVAIVVMLSSCAAMERLDEVIWNPPGTVPGATTQPASGYSTPGQPTAPPIIEIIAAAIAAGGFGGMARWLHNIRKSSNGHFSKLEDRVQKLEFKNAERSHDA